MSTRMHIVVTDDLHSRLEAARGDVPRSKFVTRAIESFVEVFEAPTRGNPMASFRQSSPPVDVAAAKRDVRRQVSESYSAADAMADRQARLNKSKGL